MTTSTTDSNSNMTATYLQHKNNLFAAESDIEKIKPFVSLNLLSAQSLQGEPALTPASGQAIITYVIAGEAAYSDSTGKQGRLQKDSWAWVIAGAGIWHSIAPITRDFIAVQMGIALSPALENSPPQTAYLQAEPNAADGDPAKLLIGWHGKKRSDFAIPSQLNYLVVPLKTQQYWSYELPLNHQFAWVTVVSGLVTTSTGKTLPSGVSIFNRPTAKIDFHAQADSILVLGSSLEFGHDLILQNTSVHTSTEALQLGHNGISAAAKILRL
ncbi:pirin family protein [Cellvibrio sp. UBA7671]|uniref:pirin family protein n=1 Tax=Cellvibrio sp. UBA7671 TaxID=1946312 RepID=UPI002F357C02